MPLIEIGPHRFNTKADVERCIRLLLESQRPTGSAFKEIAPEHTEFVAALLDLHPHKNIVIGPGVKRYCCEACGPTALRFMIERVDGTIWDFSWRNCISPPTQAKRLNSVLRIEVQDQIDEFRRSLRFPLQCPVSKDIIYASNCHVDHAKPNTFAAIVDRWLQATGYSPDFIELLHKDKYGGRSSIKDAAIAQQWKNYHRANANLRAVSVRANLSILRKGA